MSAKLLELEQRRAALSARIENQRAELGQSLKPVRRVLAVADRGVSAMRYARRHPVILIGAAACVAVFRPARAFTWLRRGFALWRMAVSLKRKFIS